MATKDGQALKESLRHPIEFLFAEHDRQRVLCASLERLAADPSSAETAAMVLAYYESELPRHVADEEQDLFPALRRRCLPDDAIGSILDLLDSEHETDHELFHRLVPALRTIAAGGRLAEPVAFAADARAFSILQRRHLAWENGTVLPMARGRLTSEDQRTLARSFAARRGVTLD
jgi:hemerythrin-like domain-containing protein